VTRTGMVLVSGIGLVAAALLALPAQAQDATAATPPAPDAQPPGTIEPAPTTPAPVCPSATSLKQCKAACDSQFPPKPKVEAPEDASARARLAIHGWWTLGAGAALLIAGGVSGGVALHLNAELKKECPGGSCPPEQYSDLDTRDRLSVASTVLLAGGLAASVVGILLLAVFSRTPKLSDAEEVEPAAAFAPSFGPGAAGAVVEWRF